MSTRRADLYYGRRGGRWAEEPGPSLDELRQQHADRWPGPAPAAAAQFHPATQERRYTVDAYIAHHRLKAVSADVYADLVRTVPVDPATLALCWAGRARMAHARLAAGQQLDDADLDAIRRHPDPPPLDPRGAP